MKKLSYILPILLLIAFIPSCDNKTASKTSEPVLVQRVIDGDTIELATGEKVRYIGINTPEIHHPRKPVEYFGKEAMEFNRKLVTSKKVHLEFDAQKRDKYSRLLAYVYLPDGTFVNAELVKEGYAQVATYPPNVKHQKLFKKLQQEARKAKRGLWASHTSEKNEISIPVQQGKLTSNSTIFPLPLTPQISYNTNDEQ